MRTLALATMTAVLALTGLEGAAATTSDPAPVPQLSQPRMVEGVPVDTPVPFLTTPAAS